MACNSCAKSFSLLRKEKGCPSCGFSYCSSCLSHKVFVQKLNSQAKVCARCKNLADSKEPQKVIPPDAYYKRVGEVGGEALPEPVDREIAARLQRLKADSPAPAVAAEDEVSRRLRALRPPPPPVSDAELRARLDRLRDRLPSTPTPTPTPADTSTVPLISARAVEVGAAGATEAEQADALLRELSARAHLDSPIPSTECSLSDSDSDNDDVRVAAVATKAELDARTRAESPAPAPAEDLDTDELPFCEICNDDATLRCLCCDDLYCRRCFRMHLEDDTTRRATPYSSPRT